MNRIDPGGYQALYNFTINPVQTLVRSALSIFYHGFHGAPPTYTITRNQTVRNPVEGFGFYQDFSVDIYGHQAGERFLVVQWIKGEFRENGEVPLVERHQSRPDTPMSFADWEVDTEYAESAEYVPLEKHQHFIMHMDQPGVHVWGGDFSSGIHFSSNLEFQTNVYSWSRFSNPAHISDFRTPTDPPPLLSIPWRFEDEYVTP
jgi:hypothetical protein